MKRRAVVLGLLCAGAMPAFGRSKVPVRSYAIEFPDHRLDFSLPEAMKEQLAFITEHYDSTQLNAFNKHEYRMLAHAGHVFGGVAGAVGILKFNVTAQQRSKQFEGDITTMAGLEKYISWWYPLASNPIVYTFGKIDLNGVPAISRRLDDTTETLSFAVDQRMFLDVHLGIDSFKGGPSANWLKRAKAMRDVIRGSIQFRSKTPGAPLTPAPTRDVA